MSISLIVYKLLPEKLFIKLRNRYRGWQKSRFKPFGEIELIKLLTNELGISKGDTIFIHGSVDFLNTLLNPLQIIEILLDVVGEEGNLVFPCWHFNTKAEKYLREGHTFDVNRSPSVMGMLSEIARRHPSAKRSLHPTNSIVAIGKNAEWLVESHHEDIYPCGLKSPYYKLMELNGKIIGIGVDTMFISFVHCPEDVNSVTFPFKTRLEEVFEAKVKDYNSEIIKVKTLAASPLVSTNNIREFLKKHVPDSICRNVYYKGNRFFIASAKELYLEIIELAKRNITIYNP